MPALEHQEYKFEEGLTYDFIVTGVIQMPPDNEEYFVIRSQTGSRHLLEKTLYKNYGLEPGMELRCKVDKINCSGKMFLEPEHPHYKVGEIYAFKILRTEDITNSAGAREKMLVVSDEAGNEVFIPYPGIAGNCLRETIDCRVERIKKGKLLLSYPYRKKQDSKLLPGNKYLFTINGIATLAEGLEFYRLEGEGELHFLRTRYYEAYEFPAKGEVWCEVAEPVVPFTHYLEPLHPCYTAGETYEFECTGVEQTSGSDGEPIRLLQLKDCMGHTYPVVCKAHDIKAGQNVRCRIEKIRMSKCYLECME